MYECIRASQGVTDWIATQSTVGGEMPACIEFSQANPFSRISLFIPVSLHHDDEVPIKTSPQ